MMMGLSYEDYWDGDCVKAKYVRQAYELIEEKENFYAWLQGEYVYEAIGALSPLLNAFSKSHKPLPYLDKPHPLTVKQSKQQKKDKVKLSHELLAAEFKKFSAAFKARNNKPSSNSEKGDD